MAALAALLLILAWNMSEAKHVVLAALLFMKGMAELTRARLSHGTDAEPRRKLPDGVVVCDIAGPLFFGAAQRAMSVLDTVAHDVKAVVFDLERVPAMDATGLVAFESSLAALDGRGVLTILAEMRDQPRTLLWKAGVRERFPRLLIRPDFETAVRAAEEHVARVADAKSSKTRVRPA